MSPADRMGADGFERLAHTRRSWLGYTGEAVHRDVIQDLVAVAGSAPSETNLQPWRFVAALGTDAVERVVPCFVPPNQPKLRDAGNVVIAYGDPSTIETDEKAARFYALGFATPRDFAVRNTALAAMVFMLAAHTRGLATRPMVGFDPAALNDALDVPAVWIPVMSMLVGHPGTTPVAVPTRRDASELVRFL